MTPIQKRNIGLGAILCCLFFDVHYFAITFEPVYYPGTNIKYHEFCAANRIVCPFCLWWFIALCIMKVGLLYFNQKHWNPKIKEERTVYLTFEFLLLFCGNLLFDLLAKIRHPEIDCMKLTGEQIIYSVLCIVIFVCRLYPHKAKKVWNVIKFVIYFKFVPYIIRKVCEVLKNNK